MKLKRILPATILGLGLTASIDAVFTSCSQNKAPEGWVEHFNISSVNIKINWFYPKKGEPLVINYQLDKNFTNIRADGRCWFDRTVSPVDMTFGIDETNKQITIDANYVWGAYETRIDLMGIK